MNRPYPNLHVIALTGNIGSGKSTAAKLFAKRGIPIIDADLLAREVVAPGSEGLKEIAEKFGANFITASGELDRAELRQLIFSDPTKRAQLERITHPKIRARYHARLAELNQRAGSRQLVVYVVPLFFEAKLDRSEISTVVVVAAPRELCIERASRRDRLSELQVGQIFDSQIPIEEKIARADFTLNNAEGEIDLENQVRELIINLTGGQQTK